LEGAQQAGGEGLPRHVRVGLGPPCHLGGGKTKGPSSPLCGEEVIGPSSRYKSSRAIESGVRTDCRSRGIEPNTSHR
jgi:hypothetical protein